jgi:hypothetical protein
MSTELNSYQLSAVRTARFSFDACAWTNGVNTKTHPSTKKKIVAFCFISSSSGIWPSRGMATFLYGVFELFRFQFSVVDQHLAAPAKDPAHAIPEFCRVTTMM